VSPRRRQLPFTDSESADGSLAEYEQMWGQGESVDNDDDDDDDDDDDVQKR
jgi:hypothetical protein